MAFCNSLRRRSSFASVVPAISTAGFKLKETKLDTHDLEIIPPSPRNAHNNAVAASQALRCLLFSPQAISASQLQSTMLRIQRCVDLTGGQNIVLVLLLYLENNIKHSSGFPKEKLTGVYAYSQLKAELLNRKDIPTIPVLPLARLDKLPSLLQTYVNGLTVTRPQIEDKDTVTIFDLLLSCTLDPPMDETLAYYITDIFNDMKELALACTTFGETLLHEAGSGAQANRPIILSDEVSPYFSSSQSQGNSVQDRDIILKNKLRRLIALNSDGAAKIIRFWTSDGLVD